MILRYEYNPYLVSFFPLLYFLGRRHVGISTMKQVSVAEILELSLQERIRLVELIWESIAAVPEAVEISPELKAELEARLREFEADPEAGYSWEQLKSRLHDGSWRTA